MRPHPAEVRIASMSRYEAEQVTGRIRSNLEENRRLIKQIYDRKGWEAIGARSFEEWGQAELKLDRSMLYRLMGAARIDEHINGDLSTMVDKPSSMGIPERVLRPLGRLLEPKDATADEHAAARARITDAWDLAHRRTDGRPTGKDVAAAVDELLADDEADEDDDEDAEDFIEEEEGESPEDRIIAEADDDDDDDVPHPSPPPPPFRDDIAAEGWTNILRQFSIYYMSIQRHGGLSRLARDWSPDRKRGYVESCREAGELFYRMASELEGGVE